VKASKRRHGRLRNSIGLKLAAATVLILVGAAAAISWTLVEHERRELFDRKEHTTVRLAEQLGLALSAPLEFDDDVAVAEALASVIDDQEVVALQVRDRDRDEVVGGKGIVGTPAALASMTRRLRWTDDALWISRPIVDDGGEVQGTLVMGMSIAAERALWTRQRDLILLASLGVALLVAVSLIAAVRKLVVQPMSRLAVAADAFGRGARPALPRVGDDEVGRVAQAFATMMVAIDERERGLAAAHAEVERLLDAMRQAVFGFGPDLTVVGRTSRAAREMFGRDDLAGVDVRGLLLAGVPEGSPEAIATSEFLEVVFHLPADAWDQAIDLAPRELCISPETADQRELVLEFVPLREAGELVRVMVVVTDETEARRMRREMRKLEDRHAAELAETRRLLGLGAHVFVDFAATTARRIDHVLQLVSTPTPAVMDEIVRKLHAARGDARALGLVALAQVLNVAEVTVAEARDSKDPPPESQWTDALRSQLALADAELAAARGRLVEASGLGEAVLHEVTVSARDLEALGEHRAGASRSLAQCIDRLQGRMLGAVVVGLDEAIGAWAAIEGKRIELEVVGAAARVGGEAAAPLRTAIVQLVRNAVAHGIESPGTRTAAGKPAVGSLRIVAEPSSEPAEPPSIAVIDDGAGIDYAELATRAAERGVTVVASELPFLDGLSTRREADALAGRGAGLAAVRDELSAVGYSVLIESTVGVGTTVRLTPRPTLRCLDVLESPAGRASP
jgi:hypothetical protein